MDREVERDAPTQPYFAGHCFCCGPCRIPGSGELDGLLTDGYTQQEQDDAIEVLRRSALGGEDDDLTKFGTVPLRIDISSEQEIKSAVESIMAEVDAVDVLVNNAAFGLYEAVEGISVDEARYQFGMNVSGPARSRHLVLPAMRVKGFGA